jgi:DNA-binding NarL/FixJ family response regulator
LNENRDRKSKARGRAAKKILLVDDHRVVLQGLRSALREEAGIEIVGEATSGETALEEADRLQPDFVIMDISMDGMSGIELAHRLRQHHGRIRILVFTMYANREYIVRLCRTGISAYVLKESPLSTLISAVRAVREGGTYFDARAQDLLSQHLREMNLDHNSESGIQTLSQRERQVFLLLAQGHAIRDIGGTLHISPKTVESHKYNIMEKLDARTVVDLTRIAIRENLIAP